MEITINIILASSSAFRKELLNKLGISFTCLPPNLDESARNTEPAPDLVMRLAEEKAAEIAKTEDQALIIGSDQVAVCNDLILGKPGNHENAVNQLRTMRGQQIQFHTGLALLNSTSGNVQVDCVSVTVQFRHYTNQEIERYLQREPAYQCAGSFKSEGLGISLVDAIRCDDPTALVGLPLIRLTRMLREEGVNIP